MECSIPKDIIEVELSYRKINWFNHNGKLFKKGNTDFILVLQPTKDIIIQFLENFKLVLIDGETNYEVPTDYYTYDGTGITIIDNKFLVQKSGQFSLVVICEDCNVSYESIYRVDNSQVSCEDIIELPELTAKYISDIKYNPLTKTHTAYNQDNEEVDSWKIEGTDSTFNGTGEDININSISEETISQGFVNDRNRLSNLDADVLKIQNEQITQNTSITNMGDRLEVLESFAESDPVYALDKPQIVSNFNDIATEQETQNTNIDNLGSRVTELENNTPSSSGNSMLRGSSTQSGSLELTTLSQTIVQLTTEHAGNYRFFASGEITRGSGGSAQGNLHLSLTDGTNILTDGMFEVFRDFTSTKQVFTVIGLDLPTGMDVFLKASYSPSTAGTVSLSDVKLGYDCIQ